MKAKEFSTTISLVLEISNTVILCCLKLPVSNQLILFVLHWICNCVLGKPIKLGVLPYSQSFEWISELRLHYLWTPNILCISQLHFVAVLQWAYHKNSYFKMSDNDQKQEWVCMSSQANGTYPFVLHLEGKFFFRTLVKCLYQQKESFTLRGPNFSPENLGNKEINGRLQSASKSACQRRSSFISQDHGLSWAPRDHWVQPFSTQHHPKPKLYVWEHCLNTQWTHCPVVLMPDLVCRKAQTSKREGSRAAVGNATNWNNTLVQHYWLPTHSLRLSRQNLWENVVIFTTPICIFVRTQLFFQAGRESPKFISYPWQLFSDANWLNKRH